MGNAEREPREIRPPPQRPQSRTPACKSLPRSLPGTFFHVK